MKKVRPTKACEPNRSSGTIASAAAPLSTHRKAASRSARRRRGSSAARSRPGRSPTRRSGRRSARRAPAWRAARRASRVAAAPRSRFRARSASRARSRRARSGRLRRKMKRQPSPSTSQPPSKGAMAPAIAPAAAQVPTARPRFSPEKEALNVARLLGSSIAAPSPCSARAPRKSVRLGATAQSTEAAGTGRCRTASPAGGRRDRRPRRRAGARPRAAR